MFGANFANSGSHSYTGPDLSGESLTILGPWMAPEDESFRDVISIFENATGATVEYGGSDEFEQIINIDCQAGSPPDIAVFPQPGLAANIAAAVFFASGSIKIGPGSIPTSCNCSPIMKRKSEFVSVICGAKSSVEEDVNRCALD